MFRSLLKAQNRLLYLVTQPAYKRAMPAVTKRHIRLIEQCAFLSLGEKIELLEMSTGRKLTTEIFSFIKQKKKLEKILAQLPFPYFFDSCTRFSHRKNKRERFKWYQVCLNENVKDLMQKYAKTLTDIELGVLYGYPLSAVVAFNGLIEKQTKATFQKASHYWFSKVDSKQFAAEENKHYELLWKQLRKISPVIIGMAEKQFKKIILSGVNKMSHRTNGQ